MEYRRLVLSVSGILALAAVLLAGMPAEGSEPAAVEAARAYVQRNLPRLGLNGADVQEMAVSSTVRSAHNASPTSTSSSATGGSTSTTA